MKKQLCILSGVMLLLSLSLNLFAQSGGEKLDQAELMKQFIGTWESEVGADTVITLKINPHNKGMFVVQENKANGNTYFSINQTIGFSDDRKMFIGTFTAADGTTIIDFGKFVSEKKMVADRYVGNIHHAAGQGMWEFSTPESFNASFRWRGNDMLWQDDWTAWTTFKKVK